MKITTIRIPDKQFEQVSEFLREREMKLSGLVRLGIKKIIEENERKTSL